MTLYNVPNVNKFLSVVDSSLGNVTLTLPGGANCDLKKDASARALLNMIVPAHEGLCITLSDRQDAGHFMRYMMETAS
ncbi:MAG: hypothetical protein HUJ72_01985 [Blautia sp.]|nr:hypothetical protein [Blautia sp.]